jgi:hypothetical protein
MTTSERVAEMLEGREHDVFVKHLLKILGVACGEDGPDEITGVCLDTKVRCYKIGNIVRIDLQRD